MRHPKRAIKERDCVVFTTDLPGDRIAAGDVGTVVHVHGGEEAFEVEFADQDGRTIALVTLGRMQIEPALNR
ncbi:MAG: DUF4926 domain-containing protein [Betaproteobacteria bacterium]